MHPQVQAIFLAAIITTTQNTSAIEININGKLFKSQIETNEIRCTGYDILIKTDQLPYELESELETKHKPLLPGFLGSASIVASKVQIRTNELIIDIPDPTRIDHHNHLIKDRRYIPSHGFCVDKNTFIISMWSGGNCTKCEAYIRYKLDRKFNVTKYDFLSIK